MFFELIKFLLYVVVLSYTGNDSRVFTVARHHVGFARTSLPKYTEIYIII